jgi:hypothetical protein
MGKPFGVFPIKVKKKKKGKRMKSIQFKNILKLVCLATLLLHSLTSPLWGFSLRSTKSPAVEESTVRLLAEKIVKKDIRSIFSNVTPDCAIEKAVKALPRSVKSFEVNDILIQNRINFIFQQIKKQTGTHDYKFIIFSNPVPVIFSDSNCIIAISTGFLNLAKDDDALFGAITHEISHGIYSIDSVVEKGIYNEAIQRNDQKAASEALNSLAQIEIKCDLLAAFVMLKCKKNTDAYIQLLNVIPDLENSVNFHPDNKIRAFSINLMKGQEVN